jgi:hypothetical protein
MEELAADRDGTDALRVRFGEPLGGAWSAPRRGRILLAVRARNSSAGPHRLGGELSRLMLAIKSLTATSRAGWTDAADRPPSGVAPGLIFDEVDAGIGGRVAEVVGRKLRALGSAFQVLCITHLPQIAACADTHFAIEKRVDRGRTCTSVSRLDADGRVEELGRMLGARQSPTGCGPRREMLANRQPAGVPADPEGERRIDVERRKRKSESEVGVARKYFIETFGCQMNFHDSERMAGLLEQAGFEATAEAADADVVVINTCSVRERAEEKLYAHGRASPAGGRTGHDPIVAVAGCVAQAEGAAIFKRSPGVADVVSGRRRFAGCRCSWSRPLSAAARRCSISIRGRCDVSAGGRRGGAIP